MNNKTPKLRFKGFTDAWEQRKFSEIASMHARIGWQNLRTSEFLDSGDYMLITGTDFNDGKINFSTCHYVEKDRYDQDKNIQIKNGNILITKDGTLGKVAMVTGLDKPATLNAGVFNIEIRDENLIDNRYLFQYLKAPFLMDYVNQKATGGTIKHLNQNILVDFPVVLPSKAEQEKIGRYFSALDNLITLHQRKLEKIKSLKKAYLDKMFPKKGKLYPELRFAGFTDAREQCKLGKCCEFINGDRSSNYPSTSEFVESGIPFVGSDALGATLIDKTQLRFITSEKYKQMNGLKIEINDILYTLRGAGFGKCAIADFSEGTISSSLVGIRCNDSLRAKFLIQWFNSASAENEKNKSVNGSTAQNISVEEMKKYALFVPGLEEQERISDYLYKLDKLITLHQRKLEKLKQLKTGYLNSMFI